VLKAITEGRAILTADLDFGRIVALSREALPSVITFRLGDMRPITVNSVLASVLEKLEPDLATGVLVSIDDRAVRVRRLPIGRK
jgi:predicted nuclease of predicted toxin-antitoxin system